MELSFARPRFQALFDMAGMIFYDDTQKCIDYAKERVAWSLIQKAAGISEHEFQQLQEKYR